MKSKQLFQVSSASCVLPAYVSADGLPVFREACNVPLIMWPNGHVCFLGTAYILQLFDKGLSRTGKGSTLHTYSTQISHLVRYCYYNNIRFEDLTDSRFTHFIKSLSVGQDRGKPPIRTDTTIAAIGRQCLSFLAFVGLFLPDQDFISPSGRIKAYRVNKTVHSPGRITKLRKVTTWHHPSIPSSRGLNTRPPISSNVISQLKVAANEASSTIYLRSRRYTLLKLLEITGGRRSEIAAIDYIDILNLKSCPNPTLRLRTMKQGAMTKVYRELPINNIDRDYLLKFVEKNLFPFHFKLGILDPSPALLVNAKTGSRLMDNTITQEIHLLAKHAKIDSKCCPHMFRHRFISKLFLALIERHEIKNPDDFRTKFETHLDFRETVRQWTGHKSIESLNIYIHMALAENQIELASAYLKDTLLFESARTLLQEAQYLLETGGDVRYIIDILRDALGILQK